MPSVDWTGMFEPSGSLVEIVIRGTLMYLGLFIILRVILKRQSGGLSVTDLLLVVLIADAAQNGMAGEYKSVPEGLLLVGTLVFWNFALDWLGYRWPWFERLLQSPPLLLIENGRILRKNLREEMITHEDLMAGLRAEGIDDPKLVRQAFMEADGKISVVKM